MGISVISVAELVYGAHRSTNVGVELAKVEQLTDEIRVFDLRRNEAEVAGRIRAQLSAVGLVIGAHDQLIAAQALANKLTLVTRNVREFERINGLSIETWP